MVPKQTWGAGWEWAEGYGVQAQLEAASPSGQQQRAVINQNKGLCIWRGISTEYSVTTSTGTQGWSWKLAPQWRQRPSLGHLFLHSGMGDIIPWSHQRDHEHKLANSINNTGLEYLNYLNTYASPHSILWATLWTELSYFTDEETEAQKAWYFATHMARSAETRNLSRGKAIGFTTIRNYFIDTTMPYKLTIGLFLHPYRRKDTSCPHFPTTVSCGKFYFQNGQWFPGGPRSRTPSFYSRGHRFDPWIGN